MLNVLVDNKGLCTISRLISFSKIYLTQTCLGFRVYAALDKSVRFRFASNDKVTTYNLKGGMVSLIHRFIFDLKIHA